MAAMAQLTRFGSYTPRSGGGFDFHFDLPRSKFKWDDKRFIRKVGEARAKALRSAGLIVKDMTKRGISQRTPRQLKSAQRVTIGQRFGFSLVALIDRVPKSNAVTSWKTPRFPNGMLRQDIQSDYDTRSKTAVIGPSQFPSLNVLHEKGGTSRRWFQPLPRRTRGNKVYGVLSNTVPRERSRWVTVNGRNRRRRGREITNSFSFQIRVTPRPYMQKGLRKAMPKIPQEFRDTIKGP